MELKNKINYLLANFKNNRNVNNHRKLVLKINYLKGLAYEYEKKQSIFLEKETQLIEGYYLEDIEILNKQLNGQTNFDLKREVLLKKMERQAYWSRRRYKTKKLRSKDALEVQNLLIIWDKEQAEKKDQYLKTLNEKYPHLDNKDELKNIQEKISALDVKRKAQFTKRDLKSVQIQASVKTFLEKNDLKISTMKRKNNELISLIENYNKKRYEEDQKLLAKYLPELETLKNTQANLKKIEQLILKIDKVQTVIKMIENDQIHLSISHLKMFFGGIKAINDLSFDVYKGEIFGLIGPNGAGKTTIFNCITQFYKATSGNTLLRNKDGHIVSLDEFKTHDMIKEGIARSFQNVELIWELTVLDNLMVAAHSLLITSFTDHMIHTRKLLREDTVIRTKGYHILQSLGIEEYAFRSPYGLPYGVLKKIELARTLMTDPSLIILDEPAAGLNDAETIDLGNVIKKVNKEFGITIFLVEHDMGLVMSICDRICAISFGKMIGLGTPKEIQSNPEVRKAYLGDDEDE